MHRDPRNLALAAGVTLLILAVIVLTERAHLPSYVTWLLAMLVLFGLVFLPILLELRRLRGLPPTSCETCEADLRPGAAYCGRCGATVLEGEDLCS